MRKTFLLTSSFLYSFWFAIVLGPIIILSISSNAWLGADFSNFHPSNGWDVIRHYGFNTIFAHGNDVGASQWWFGANYDANGHFINNQPADWEIVCVRMLLFLIIIDPILFVLFTMLTLRLYFAVLYPKSIEFIDSIKLLRHTSKMLRKTKRKTRRLCAKNKITVTELTNRINQAEEALHQAQLAYNKFASIWSLNKKQSTHQPLIFNLPKLFVKKKSSHGRKD